MALVPPSSIAPATVTVAGTVAVSNLPADQLVHFAAVQHVIVDSGAVNVGNFPATYPVTQSTSPWVVDGSGVTQPVSVAVLPLPAGAATEVSLDKVRRAANDVALTAILDREKVDE